MAISEFTKAIGVNPNYTNAYWMRGYSYEKLGQEQNVITDYTKAIQLDPDYADAYNNRGFMQYWVLQHQEAINDLNEAIRIDPDDSYPYFFRATAYRSWAGDYQCEKTTPNEKCELLLANTDADKAKACSLDSRFCVWEP